MSTIEAMVLGAALLLAACGGGGADDAAPDAAPLVDAGPDDYRADRIGAVRVLEQASSWAELHDGPELPTPVRSQAEGDCAVYVRPAPALCEPACTDGVCVATGSAAGQCEPWPARASAGPITVTGLRAAAQPFVFQPGDFGYTPPAAAPEDLFADDATLTIRAPGAATPGFEVTLGGVAPLVAPFQNLTLVDGEDASYTWTASSGGARVQLALVVGWHGGPPRALLLCETDDDGALTVPGSLIAALPRDPTSMEQHPSTLIRFRRATVASSAGPIEVLVGSQQYVYFLHP